MIKIKIISYLLFLCDKKLDDNLEIRIFYNFSHDLIQ